jgi:hypothetical protein
MKQKLAILSSRLHEINNLVKTKNPSLLLQLQKSSIGNTSLKNNISSCIPVGDFGNITGTSWTVDSWMINAWYEYDGIVYNFSSDYILWYDDAQVRLQPLSEYAFDASKWTNSTGYNGPLTGNFYVTLMAVLVDAYGTGYTRVVEKTKVFSVQKNITLTGPTTRRENKYKLVADDTGATQCVLMDCSVTSDCSGLPDC